MSPEQAEDYYYQQYRELMVGRDYDRPVVQAEIRKECWRRVVSEIEKPWKELIAQRITEDAIGPIRTP